ncbi:MAG: GNAT family N-acetyltransferase [Deltaproteobacteria bacterium]|nr:GNAT family N-acetyltransferase [Deltaproteobacteria bacterium]
MPYHEHKFLEGGALKYVFMAHCKRLMSGGISLMAYQDGKPVALLSAVKDEFDSEIFGMPCYRITDFVFNTGDVNEIQILSKALIEELERILPAPNDKVHIAIGINNNVLNSDRIFNSLVRSGFYYIHTLLSFGLVEPDIEPVYLYPETGLSIRIANNADAAEVSGLASQSFRYSRFHLDPYLDNEKAGQLLCTSASNSILQGFADIMFVAEIKGKIVGYYSAKKKHIPELNKILGEVIVSAIDPEMRGMGVFTKLDHHIQKWFFNNTDFAELGTYLANYPVHKTWINKRLPLLRGTHQFSKLLIS